MKPCLIMVDTSLDLRVFSVVAIDFEALRGGGAEREVRMQEPNLEREMKKMEFGV